MYDETPATPAPREDYPDAADILRAAGWRPHDGWGVYTHDTLVMGFQPDGLAFHVKNWAKIPPGHPQHSADTPDTPEEAAAWLVERFRAPDSQEALAAPQIALADEGGAPEIEGHEQPVSAIEASGDGEAPATVAEPADEPAGDVAGGGEDAGEAIQSGLDDEPIDADWTESEAFDRDLALALEGPDGADSPLLEFGEEMAEAEAQDQAGGQFIFGDNLDQKRTAAIGLVMRYARSITPAWDEVADHQLASMRNFAMGVSEGRWPDDPIMRDELGALEGTLRTIHAIEAVTRDKVAFLEAAGREEIEAFVVEHGWP